MYTHFVSVYIYIASQGVDMNTLTFYVKPPLTMQVVILRIKCVLNL